MMFLQIGGDSWSVVVTLICRDSVRLLHEAFSGTDSWFVAVTLIMYRCRFSVFAKCEFMVRCHYAERSMTLPSHHVLAGVNFEV